MLNYPHIESVLAKYNLYFRSLSMPGKLRFIERVTTLSESIQIIGRDIEVDDEKRIILYSYFVQITLGFSNYIPGDYTVIHLFENTFQNRNSDTDLEGKTFAEKMIALSWYHFSKSHLLANDGENLGFFHLGQALVQSLLNGRSSDDIFCAYFDPCAKQVFGELLKNQNHPLYLAHPTEIKAEDFQSFFPYLMEWFFEKPAQLKTELPNTYAHLCVLMNQDPLAFENDYKLNKASYQNKKGVNPLPEKIRKTFAYYRSHWIYNLPFVVIIFLPAFYAYYVRHHLLLQTHEILLMYGLLSVALFFGTKGFFVGRKLFNSRFWFGVFTLTGLAPAVLFLVFLISFQIPVQTEISSHPIEESVSVIGRHSSRSGRGTSYVKYYQVYFRDNFLYDYPESREFYPEDQPRVPVSSGTYACYEIGRSIFGFKVIKQKFLLEIMPVHTHLNTE